MFSFPLVSAVGYRDSCIIGPFGQKLSGVTGSEYGNVGRAGTWSLFYSFPYKDPIYHHLPVMMQDSFYL